LKTFARSSVLISFDTLDLFPTTAIVLEMNKHFQI
jgi:hypothetical protein